MEDNHIRIDKFLRKQLTPEENEKFLNDLKNDQELRKEAQITALMIKEFRERQAKQDAEIIEEVLASKKKAKIIRLVRWSMSIAAMFILIAGATIWWNSRLDTEALFTKHYTPYSMQSTLRGGDSNVKKELATLFNQVGTADDISPVIDKLQKIYDSRYSEYEYRQYADDIAWYLALAYLKDDNIEKAKELLQPLAKKGDMKAKALLEELE